MDGVDGIDGIRRQRLLPLRERWRDEVCRVSTPERLTSVVNSCRPGVNTCGIEGDVKNYNTEFGSIISNKVNCDTEKRLPDSKQLSRSLKNLF